MEWFRCPDTAANHGGHGTRFVLLWCAEVCVRGTDKKGAVDIPLLNGVECARASVLALEAWLRGGCLEGALAGAFEAKGAADD